MTGFKTIKASELFTQHQVKIADSRFIAGQYGYPSDNWSDEQVSHILQVVADAKSQGLTIRQYLQTPQSGPQEQPDINISALTAAAVTPAVLGTQATLQTVQQGMTQIVEQGSDAIVQMSGSVVPAMLAMAAEKGSGPKAMAQAQAVQAEVAKTFGSFRIPTQLRTALPATGDVGPVAGQLRSAD
jgi:hypothetical protein